MDKPDLYGAYNKLLKVIDSCKTQAQFDSAEQYADLFYEMYDEEMNNIDDLVWEKMDAVIATKLGNKRVKMQK